MQERDWPVICGQMPWSFFFFTLKVDMPEIASGISSGCYSLVSQLLSNPFQTCMGWELFIHHTIKI